MSAAVNDCYEFFRPVPGPVEVVPLHHDGDIVVRLCEGSRALRGAHMRYMRLYVVLHRAGGELWTHAYRVEHPADGGKALVHLLKVRPGNHVPALGQWVLECWLGGVFGGEATAPEKVSLPSVYGVD